MSHTRIAPDQLAEAMKHQTEHFLREVAQAVSDAPDGAWIAGSEERVRDLSAEYRRQVFEKAMQMRIDQAEAAFPPSARSNDGQTPGQ